VDAAVLGFFAAAVAGAVAGAVACAVAGVDAAGGFAVAGAGAVGLWNTLLCANTAVAAKQNATGNLIAGALLR
jgi:hypothetical protein